MANNRRPFYWKLSSANIMSDGMLKDISYGDYALMMAVNDIPLEDKDTSKHDENGDNENKR
ncbi:hypothetical protein [Proteiniborus sp. MB09-C3]|uniref:hypothetical protein n=1 Tax=Proteiniborus sp. MB09-C3 TaxID=3050072 RepID=UPI0025536116|nr:hypothetical protein [Proteiniborus sp. MB09-C3]WIV11990.1 hypothetical protein QO263_18135 [Proteiniborus sp. MB09-C3]